MNKQNQLAEISNRFTAFVIQMACIIIDTVFLMLWVTVQYFFDSLLIQKLALSGISLWVLRVFQVIFAVSTLFPVIIYIYVDIRIMIARARKQIKEEI